MFSATFSDEIRQLAKSFLRNPAEVSVTPKNSTAKTVKQWLHPVDKAKKAALLTHLIQDNAWQQALVFCRTKHGANKLTRQLEGAGITAAAIHGNKSQGARTRALAEFKTGDIRILVATDIAARGLDIDQLPQVVNFDLPNVPEDYVHRIGRTGRAGASGHAVSLVSADEHKQLVAIERLIGKVVGRDYIGGFEPDHELPASPTPRPHKPKRPKKPKPAQGEGQRSHDSNRDHKRGGQKSSRPAREDQAKARSTGGGRGKTSQVKTGQGRAEQNRGKSPTKGAKAGDTSQRNRSGSTSSGNKANSNRRK